MAVDGSGRPGRSDTAVLAGLTAAVLTVAGWWWVANEPPAARVVADAITPARGPLGEPNRSVTIRVGPDDRLPVLTDESRRRHDLWADAWQLLPERPGTLASTARVVTEQQTVSLGVSGVTGERYLIEWFCLGTGEMRMWRGRDGERETVDCLPSAASLTATTPADGEVRITFHWTSQVAALIGIQISVP